VKYEVDKEVTKELLAVFSKQLEKSGSVFIDIIDNDSFDKQARVISELESSDLMILIETNSIYHSEWVALEIEKAKSRQIPIRKVSINELSNYKMSLVGTKY
jgi:hypothetical protein